MRGLTIKHFVLKPRGNTQYHRASRIAMNAYARSIRKENCVLARDLEEWVAEETLRAGGN